MTGASTTESAGAEQWMEHRVVRTGLNTYALDPTGPYVLHWSPSDPAGAPCDAPAHAARAEADRLRAGMLRVWRIAHALHTPAAIRVDAEAFKADMERCLRFPCSDIWADLQPARAALDAGGAS